MGKALQIRRIIQEAIGTFFDILDFLTYFTSAITLTSGGGAVVGWLYQIPIGVIALLSIISGSCFVITITRIVIRYKKWKETKGIRERHLEITAILREMNDRTTTLTEQIANSNIDAKRFQLSLVRFNEGADEKFLKLLSSRKSELNKLKPYLRKLGALLDTGLDEALKGDDTYPILSQRLNAIRTSDEKIENMIDEHIAFSYDMNSVIIFISGVKSFLEEYGILTLLQDDVKLIQKLYPPNMKRILNTELARIQKRIERYSIREL